MELTYKNHFKYGYDKRNDFSHRVNANQSFSAEYGRCERWPASYGEECVRAAKKIHELNPNQTFWLFLSGGIDSEFMVKSFLKADIPFKTVTVSFKDGLNEQDVFYAKKIARDQSLDLKVFDLDIKKWWEQNLVDYAVKYQCTSPQLPPLWGICEKLDGIPIFALGDQVWIRPEGEHSFYLREKEVIQSHYRYFLAQNRFAVPGFLHYTAEQMLSFVLSGPQMTLFLFGERAKMRSNSNDFIKWRTYCEHHTLERRKKITGYEKVMDSDTFWRNLLLEKLPGADGVHLTSFRDLSTQLWPQGVNKEFLVRTLPGDYYEN